MEQLSAVDRQIKRIEAFEYYFKTIYSFPFDEDLNEKIKDTYNVFAAHRSKADQEIARACAQTLDEMNMARRDTIMKGIKERIPALLQETKAKLVVMEKHSAAFRSNPLYYK